MDKVLQTLNVKLDSTMQTLTERAIGQLLVKIIFHHSCPITEKELIKKYKTEVKSLYNEARTKNVLTSLISENDVKEEKNKQFRF